MAIVRWTPSNDLASLHSAMDRLFGDMFGDALAWPGERGNGNGDASATKSERSTYHLPINVRENEKGYRIEAPVPGFRPEDVEVTFSDGVLTIDAKRTDERTREDGSYVRREVAFGNYRRSITLPGEVRADDIRANFQNGILTLEVPRAPRPEPKRIQIQSGERSMSGAGARRN